MELSNSIPTYIKKIFIIARQASILSDYQHYNIGAVIFDKHRIYAIGYNQLKSLPMQKEFNPCRGFDDDACKHFGHAEMIAVHRLIQSTYDKNINISHLSICIYREHRNGDYALAKPCKACESAIRKLGIKNIYYTGDKSLVYERYE